MIKMLAQQASYYGSMKWENLGTAGCMALGLYIWFGTLDIYPSLVFLSRKRSRMVPLRSPVRSGLWMPGPAFMEDSV